ncbi:glutathione S-transferase family protein [Variovorax ureilyticus]|uniref:glutathione S-transferase family protein n=1 Tax=Variovorax ureilyticus TaxID=1836198 RepID=UPI003D6721F0
MNLFICPGAPSPTRVRLYVAEKNAAHLAFQVTEVVVNLQAGEQHQTAHLARNPLGRVPVLELDDGMFLGESLAIIEYLEDRFPEPSMLGRTPVERARVRELDRVAELRVLLPLGRLVHYSNSPMARQPQPALADHYRSMLPVGLGFIEGRLRDGRPFIAGDRPTVVDCTLAAALDFGRRRGVPLDDEYGEVAAWFERYRARAAVRQVMAP